MQALVLMVKPNPKAPLLAWATRPHPLPRQHSSDTVPQGSPTQVPQVSTLPYILLRRRGLARVQSSPQTVLRVGDDLIFLDTGSMTSQEVYSNINNCYYMLSTDLSDCYSLRYYLHVIDEKELASEHLFACE